MKIYATVTVYDGVELLPHFVEHYARLGVDTLLVGLAKGVDATLPASVDGMGIKVFSLAWTYLDDAQKDNGENWMLGLSGCTKDDWVLRLDLDEYQTYPLALRTIIELAEQQGLDAVNGELCDRVALNKMPRPVEPSPAIWQQFPVCLDVSGWMNSDQRKIMAARSHVFVTGGRHTAPWGKVGQPAPGDYKVHHFKWHGSVLDRLRGRSDSRVLTTQYKQGILDLLAYVKDNGELPGAVQETQLCSCSPIRQEGWSGSRITRSRFPMWIMGWKS